MNANGETKTPEKKIKIETLESATVRFAGDSGDGMQLAGTQFTKSTAIFGNDLSTLPDFPAEIRAPAGSLPGVSGFQISFSSHDTMTPGDEPDAMVIMNPAALKVNVKDLSTGGLLIVNEDAFTDFNLGKAGYVKNPLEDGSLSKYRLIKIPITTLTFNALKKSDLNRKAQERSKNFTALGIAFWLYNRPVEPTLKWIKEKFGKIPEVAEANTLALKTGFNFASTAKLFTTHYNIKKAKVKPGTYRNITGNVATALGFIAAAELSNTQLVYASYPITPASEILHEIANHTNFGAKTIQAEDEIAAMGAAVGAAFAGSIAITGTSGPGLALKSEAINLAIMTELPIVIANIQRAGPSTGMPTKTEQSDLLQSMFGRNGDSPIPILASSTPEDCFFMAFEAVRFAVHAMTPVLLLSDGYLGFGAEPFKIPSLDDLPKIEINHYTDPENFNPYMRNPKTLARPWVKVGTPGLEHRLGGLEKADLTGAVTYDPMNHQQMSEIRLEKVNRLARLIPNLKVKGPKRGKLLVLGWGSTYGAITSAVSKMQKAGYDVASAHLNYINPFPRNLEKILKSYDNVLIPELNMGQLSFLIRAKYLIEPIEKHKVMGKPFFIHEIQDCISEILEGRVS